MALTRSLMRAMATSGLPPAQALLEVNRHLLEMNKSNMFVTMLYGILVLESREFSYARAGHEVPILVRSDGSVEKISHSAGQFLGVFTHPLIDQQTVYIPPGSALLLYTDGASDASNGPNSYFGGERIQAALQRHRDLSAQEICNQITADILEFQGAAAQFDDITLIVVKSR
jgi:phosphoserine phosphatase RsbU/P